ncbi:MAG: hypothetical protein WCH99_04005 [Verrucomicrobiota bacterium]
MANIKVICKKCGNVFDWNDRWPDGLKRCPLCGVIAPPTAITAEASQPVTALTAAGFDQSQAE